MAEMQFVDHDVDEPWATMGKLRDALAGPEWTSVDDALPEVCRWYLVAWYDDFKGRWMQDVVLWLGKLWDYEYDGIEYTYWRELPDPPEVDNG